MRIVVSGRVAGTPHQGGAVWAVLQYVLGLGRLGHDVWLVEETEIITASRESFFRAVAEEFLLVERAALLERGTRRSVGMAYQAVLAAAAGADLLLNLSGTLRDEVLLEAIPLRVYVDLDPAFTQLWHAQGVDVGLEPHHRFATVGTALAAGTSVVPTLGIRWLATRPPVVLERWRPAGTVQRDFTTVANWRSYGSIEHDGIVYGQKAHSLRELIQLPTMASGSFQLALSIHADETRDLLALRAHGWGLLDPRVVAGTPAAYSAFIGSSRAELGVAKAGYVTSACGWFSDRSACYLASGRPVVAQETGFSKDLPTGEGLLSFATVDQAVACIEAVNGDWARHAAAARELAEAYFDSDLVLSHLLESVTA